MTWTWQTLGIQPVLWTLQTLKSTDREWPTEQYTPWTLQTLNAIDSEPHWILDWTLPTLNNSRQTMNAVDCNPANTEHHWLCMLQTLPYRLNALKKLNWCYRLWTLLALNAIELSRPNRLTLNTVYTESYWHINSTELTLHSTLHNTEKANCSERYP